MKKNLLRLLGSFALLTSYSCSSNTGNSPTLVATAPSTSCTGPSTYWVSPTGSDSNNGSMNSPFLTIDHARQVVSQDPCRGNFPITVNIQGGTYRLKAPIVFTANDSGKANAPIIYQAAQGAQVVISGGQQITGWTQADATLNIWKAQATVQTSTMPRQLYVNGTRATRARTVDYPNYYTPSDTGYTYNYLVGLDPQIPPTWKNPSVIEAVTVTQWKMMRCPVAQINGNDVIMQQPCWKNANVYPYPWNFHLLSWFENAYEFLSDPGEWYLDPTDQMVYYIPLAGENLATADVELPVLEMLIVGNGTVTAPVSFIQFQGFNFQYGTWLGPNSPDGYALDQSGFHIVGPDHQPNLTGHDQFVVRTPGNLSFTYAQNITFANNQFSHFGGVALDFGTGSQFNQILGNTFTDISGAAIQMGGVDPVDQRPTTNNELTCDNLISNNAISYIGQEFYDAPGIYVGITTRTTVEYNEISYVPWSGIAIGWGWGLLDPGGFPGILKATPNQWGVYTTPTAAHGNQILHNSIEYFLLKLWDGGAIYSTGFQGTSLDDGQLIAWNVAQNKRPQAGGNIFYTDGGSNYITLRGNVSLNNPQGYMDFGPCLKASSFSDLCLSTNIIGYGGDIGGCIPYGNILFDTNYMKEPTSFYTICSSPYAPNNPINMNYTNNVSVTTSAQVPASILNNAGNQKNPSYKKSLQKGSIDETREGN